MIFPSKSSWIPKNNTRSSNSTNVHGNAVKSHPWSQMKPLRCPDATSHCQKWRSLFMFTNDVPSKKAHKVHLTWRFKIAYSWCYVFFQNDVRWRFVLTLGDVTSLSPFSAPRRGRRCGAGRRCRRWWRVPAPSRSPGPRTGSWASLSWCRRRSHAATRGGCGDASEAGWRAGPGRWWCSAAARSTCATTCGSRAEDTKSGFARCAGRKMCGVCGEGGGGGTENTESTGKQMSWWKDGGGARWCVCGCWCVRGDTSLGQWVLRVFVCGVCEHRVGGVCRWVCVVFVLFLCVWSGRWVCLIGGGCSVWLCVCVYVGVWRAQIESAPIVNKFMQRRHFIRVPNEFLNLSWCAMMMERDILPVPVPSWVSPGLPFCFWGRGGMVFQQVIQTKYPLKLRGWEVGVGQIRKHKELRERTQQQRIATSSSTYVTFCLCSFLWSQRVNFPDDKRKKWR